MIINKKIAVAALHQAAKESGIDKNWANKVRTLSELCEKGVSKTHIAFLGTSILARTVDESADLIFIKPKLAPDNPNAYSARSLCHSVLVPISAELNFDIGVSGREPLNNQPYFRMSFLGDDTPVHAGGREAFEFMFGLVKELSSASSVEAGKALAAFVSIRRDYSPRFAEFTGGELSAPEVITALRQFVGANSEGGKRAQAVAAGLVDVFAGPDRVLSGRINDPSRKFPGDVCVLSSKGRWERAFEVRDKPVAYSDAIVFSRKCVSLGVREAAIVMVSPKQDKFDLGTWPEDHGIGVTLFWGWEELANQCFFWCDRPSPKAAVEAMLYIYDRLIEVEVSARTIDEWNSLSANTN